MLHAGYGGAGSIQSYPALLGTSGAGIIEKAGGDVTGLATGDRVVFDTQAYIKAGEENLRQGSWQRFVICDSRTVAKIGNTPFEQATLIEFPLQTAVMALHVFLGMGKPGIGEPTEKVLVWGAGGAVGSYAVQYANSVGHTVVVTASARDVDRQKKLGAMSVVDYKATDAVDQLRALGPYKYLLTASGDPLSQRALAALLQPDGGKFASVLGGEVELPSNVMRIYLSFSQAAQKDEFGDFRSWWYCEYLPDVLGNGRVEPVQFTKRESGLEALQQASLEVFEGKIKGKIVVNPQE